MTRIYHELFGLSTHLAVWVVCSIWEKGESPSYPSSPHSGEMARRSQARPGLIIVRDVRQLYVTPGDFMLEMKMKMTARWGIRHNSRILMSLTTDRVLHFSLRHQVLHWDLRLAASVKVLADNCSLLSNLTKELPTEDPIHQPQNCFFIFYFDMRIFSSSWLLSGPWLT